MTQENKTIEEKLKLMELHLLELRKKRVALPNRTETEGLREKFEKLKKIEKSLDTFDLITLEEINHQLRFSYKVIEKDTIYNLLYNKCVRLEKKINKEV